MSQKSQKREKSEFMIFIQVIIIKYNNVEDIKIVENKHQKGTISSRPLLNSNCA